MKKVIGKFLVDTFLSNALSATGQQVGQAIGERLAALVKKPEPKKDPKDKANGT